VWPRPLGIEFDGLSQHSFGLLGAAEGVASEEGAESGIGPTPIGAQGDGAFIEGFGGVHIFFALILNRQHEVAFGGTHSAAFHLGGGGAHDELRIPFPDSGIIGQTAQGIGDQGLRVPGVLRL